MMRFSLILFTIFSRITLSIAQPSQSVSSTLEQPIIEQNLTAQPIETQLISTFTALDVNDTATDNVTELQELSRHAFSYGDDDSVEQSTGPSTADVALTNSTVLDETPQLANESIVELLQPAAVSVEQPIDENSNVSVESSTATSELVTEQENADTVSTTSSFQQQAQQQLQNNEIIVIESTDNSTIIESTSNQNLSTSSQPFDDMLQESDNIQLPSRTPNTLTLIVKADPQQQELVHQSYHAVDDDYLPSRPRRTPLRHHSVFRRMLHSLKNTALLSFDRILSGSELASHKLRNGLKRFHSMGFGRNEEPEFESQKQTSSTEQTQRN